MKPRIQAAPFELPVDKGMPPFKGVVRRACCLGGRVDAWTARCGVVHSVLAGAVHLRFGDTWWTLLAADRPDQPSGIRLAPDAAGLPAVRPGDPVEVRAGLLLAGGEVIDCRAATRWAPAEWPAPTPGFAARLRQLEFDAMPRAWPGAEPMARSLCETFDSDLALAVAVRCVVGRGPGGLPSGDGVIVGLLTAFGMRCVPMRERLARAVAPALRTTNELSRHLVDEAARGLPGRALHELGEALLSGAHLAGASHRLLGTGASSGADIAVGLVAGSRHLLAAGDGASPPASGRPRGPAFPRFRSR